LPFWIFLNLSYFSQVSQKRSFFCQIGKRIGKWAAQSVTCQSMSRQKIRWAIGSSDGPRSSTWVLWENKKGDIYAAARRLGGAIKASFHRDSKCQLGFTSEYEATASRRFGVSKRLWEKWRLPDDPVVRVLQILVPHSELRAFADRSPTDDVTWLPVPPAGSIGEVWIFISKPGIDRLVIDQVPDVCSHPIWSAASEPAFEMHGWFTFTIR
jgi:hypothetical protein